MRNITVYVVRLDGHGTSVEDLANKKWEDWYKNYREAYLSVKQSKSKVFVGGISLGGALALKIAEDENVDGVIALAPALELSDGRTNYAWLFKYIVKYNSRVIPEIMKGHAYERFPLSGVAETVEFGKIVKRDLGKISEPILIMQYENDTRILPGISDVVYGSVGSEVRDLYLINGTGHVFIIDEGKEKYFEEIYQFIRRNSE